MKRVKIKHMKMIFLLVSLTVCGGMVYPELPLHRGGTVAIAASFTGPPDTFIDSVPPELDDRSTAEFVFSSNDPSASFQCAVSNEFYFPCSSPWVLTSFEDGEHAFYVRAVRDGLPDPSPAIHSWFIDTSGPDTAIILHPPNLSHSTFSVFVFDSPDNIDRFECSINSSPFSTCFSPFATNVANNLTHSFRVRAIGLNGTPDPVPAEYVWTVATTAGGSIWLDSWGFKTPETVGSQNFTVFRHDDTTLAVTVDFEVSSGSATAGDSCNEGVDYVTTAGTLSFSSGQNQKLISVQICDDAIFEPDETFEVRLSNPAGDSTLGQFDFAVVTITDNDIPLTLTVDNNSDLGSLNTCDDGVPNDCSLRGAISAANYGDTIAFDPAIFTSALAPNGTLGTIVLEGSEIVIDELIVIEGPGVGALTIDGGPGSNRIFRTDSSKQDGSRIILRNLILTGGNGDGAVEPGLGGAIYSAGRVWLDRVKITGNSAVAGGGIFNTGDLLITESMIDTNSTTASGGGIFNIGASQIGASTISGNSADLGGGISHTGGDLSIWNTTISGNSASVRGGGFHTNWGNVDFLNTTVTLNDGGSEGGGGLACYLGAGTLTIANSIIAGNSQTPVAPEIYNSCSHFISSGFNMIGDEPDDALNTINPISYLATDILDSPPLLGPMADNGGPTPTHALMPGSPALDAGSALAFDLTTDQRGSPRTVDLPDIPNVDDGTDIGAFEFLAPTAASVSIGGRVTDAGGRGIYGARLIMTDENGAQLTAISNPFGYYRFDGVIAGGSYIVAVSSRRHTFAVPQILVTADSDIADLDFVASGP